MKITHLISAAAMTLLLASPAMAQGTSTQGTQKSSPPAATTTSPTSKLPTTQKAPQTAAAPTDKGRQIDLNSASPSELDTLPGIGKARADAIVKNRPYKNKDELVSRHIIPNNVYDGIKDRVTVR